MNDVRHVVVGNLIDGFSPTIKKNICLTIQDGDIVDMQDAKSCHTHEEFCDDLSHCTILPAFIDCSIGLTQSPSLFSDKDQPQGVGSADAELALVNKHIRYCYGYGVLGVAENSALTTFFGNSPHGVKANPPITIRTTISPAEFGKHTAISADDSTFVRINYSEDIGVNCSPNSSFPSQVLERYLGQCDNKKTIIVANGPQQVAEALEAGCDAIEQGYAMGKENLKRMAQQDVMWIPNVLRAKNGLDSSGSGGDVCCRFSQRYVSPGNAIPGAEEFWRKTVGDQLSLLSLARDFGVNTAVGTGAGAAGILHGESVTEEIKLFIKAGYSLPEAIRCCSENGARFFGIKELGALQVGRKATFLITRGSVGQLPRKLSFLEGMYINGSPADFTNH